MMKMTRKQRSWICLLAAWCLTVALLPAAALAESTGAQWSAPSSTAGSNRRNAAGSRISTTRTSRRF